MFTNTGSRGSVWELPESTVAESWCAGHCVGAADLTWVVPTECLHVPSAVAVGSALQHVQNCVCMRSIWLFQWHWNDLYYTEFHSWDWKKKNDRSEINTAARILPWRTPYCNVLWESSWGVTGKPIMVIQVVHPWHICVVAVSMKKIERNNLHFLCRRTGKTKPCCDKRMDFVE